MQTVELDTRSAPVKWWAARDARIRSYANSTLYTETEKIRAERMRGALELCYMHSGVHVNFRQRFVAVKVDGAEVKRRGDLRLLEQDWANEGITKRASAQGIIYRIPRG
jgi:hypothetical protein